MNKILLIIQREYLSRVKKKSFLWVTFLVPIFLIGIYALVIYLATNSITNTSAKVNVIDQSGQFAPHLENRKQIEFDILNTDPAEEKQRMIKDGSKAILLVIPPTYQATLDVDVFSIETAGFAVQNEITNQLEAIYRKQLLEASGIDMQKLESIQPNVNLFAKELSEAGEKDSSAGAAMIISMVLAILVYLSLFLYGAQVMRGIIEEKNNRIVEVIISSVKPFQLMLGKIIGIGLVGITQFLLWILLSSALMAGASSLLVEKDQIEQQTSISIDEGNSGVEVSKNQSVGNKIMQNINTINFTRIISYFFCFFIGGYLLYSALFAAVGSAVDNETETQQFMLPITMPLLLAYMLSFAVLVNDPNGTLAVWLSMIPLTSPVAMMVRIPFGVPDWQIILSIVLLVIGFLVTTWVAARIYRVGILMYGKKASYKELAKWFRYKG
jgi:ABC-2 type transport system permease protein